MDKKLENMPGPYKWVIEKKIAGYEAFTALQPWYFLKESDLFYVNEQWPSGPSKRPLLAFARRQDNDDIACFELSDMEPMAVILIHGWTNQGYDICVKYNSFWDWMKSVIDDIAEWSDA